MTSSSDSVAPGRSGPPPGRSGGAPDPLVGLSPTEAGFVLALALDGVGGGIGPAGDAQGVADADVRGSATARATAALGGPGASACRDALAALAALPRSERARALSRLILAVRAPLPAGIDRVHPGWLRSALDGEATEILLAIADGLPAVVQQVAREIVAARGEEGTTPAAVEADRLAELRRAVFSSFVTMPGPAGGVGAPEAPSSSWVRLAALPVEALRDEIARAGAEALGTSLVGAPPVVVARAAARSGGGAIAAIVLETSRRGPDDRARALARVAVAAAGGLDGAGELGPATAVGLIVLAQRLARESEDAPRVIAHRLPPALGTVLLEHCAREPG